MKVLNIECEIERRERGRKLRRHNDEEDRRKERRKTRKIKGNE